SSLPHLLPSPFYTLSLHDALPISGLDNREVVAPSECPILESLTSRAALFDIRVGGRRRHDHVREALRNDDTSLYRTVRRVLLKRSEEHTSELQSRGHLVCRLLLEK